MSWLDRFSTDRNDGSTQVRAGSRRVRDLIAQARFREALAEIEASGGPDAAGWAAEVSQRAAVHWLREAENACHQGEREQMNAALAEAARYYRDDLGPVFREARRRIRSRILELTSAPHWVALLHAATDQRAVHFSTPSLPAPSSYAAFANERLVALVARKLGETALATDALERIDAKRLEAARDLLKKAYPDSLAARIDEVSGEFVRAALHVASGRPDLAVLPLLELPVTQPLVCLERARVAYALGYPGTAMLALSDFRTNHGGHETVRRLHTGVFMAQMAVQCGDAERAVEILETVPLEDVGRRPVLLYAQLLGAVGRVEDGRNVLEGWLATHPDDEEARALAAELDDPSVRTGSGLMESPQE